MSLEFINRATVLIRTKNVEQIVVQTLASLFSQDFKAFDVLAVDSGSVDRTLDVLQGFNVQVQTIPPADYFPGKVLNRAIENLHSEIIVFLNSDAVLLTPDSLSNLLSPFQDESIQAVFGRQIPRPDAKTWVKYEYGKSFPDNPKAPWWIPLSLPIAAMRRSIWTKRPFYTDCWGSEDTEWGHWARENGIKVFYACNALAMHSHNYTLRQLYGRRFIEGEADAFIYKKPYSLGKCSLSTIKSLIRDIAVHAESNDYLGLAQMPCVRLVYFWAYYQGHRLGCRRLARRDIDSGIGQKTVLKRYGP